MVKVFITTKSTVLFLLITLVMIAIPTVDAQTSKLIIPTHLDTSTDEENPDTNKIVAYEDREGIPYDTFDEWVFLTSGWTPACTNCDGKNSQDEEIKVFQTLAYMKFNLSGLETTSALNEVETEAFVELMIQEIVGKGESALVTLIPCEDNSWDNSVVWDNHVCHPPNNQGEDSILIHEKDLPNRFAWDVSKSIIKASKSDISEITFVVSSIPMQDADTLMVEEQFQNKAFNSATVKIWSKELNKFGKSAAPTLIIHQNTESSSLRTGIDYFLITVLPTLAIIVPVGIWLYNKEKKKG